MPFLFSGDMHEEIYFENENVWFIGDDMTRDIDRYLAKPDNNGISLSDWRLIKVRRKSDRKQVCVFWNPKTDEFGSEVVGLEGAYFEADIMKLRYKFRTDIVEMAINKDFPNIF